jgi:thymidine kinase
MPYGKLTVVVGPMFAGKTEEIVKEVLYRSHFSGPDKGRIGVFKHAIDTRYSDQEIVSHDGAAIRATRVSGIADLVDTDLDFAFFDEVQFFNGPNFDGDILDVIRAMRGSGTDVLCAGLDMDYMGRAFEVTASLMAEATEIRRMTAICEICGAPATHTMRHDSISERILLGSGDSYSAACVNHWFERVLA